MKQLIILCTLILASGISIAEMDCPQTHPQPEAYDGWHMSVQTWSFNRFTLFEAIDKTRSLGVNRIQAYPNQKVAPDIDAVMNHELSPENKAKLKKKLDEAGVELCAYGVVGIPKDETGARRLFEFAKEMGIETIVSEPEDDQFDLLDKLCREYEIKLGIHNHPNPSHYWNPETVLKACEGRSEWIGACTDVGHWVRSGLDPVDCLKMLEGRIVDVHMKEVSTEDLSHDVIWGQGRANAGRVLEELHRQGYKGTFAVEYEAEWDNNVPFIRKSLDFYNKAASVLNPTGWKPVFEPDLSNADLNEGGWVFENGELICKLNGDLWTKESYGDFILDFEFKLADGTNSGIFLRAGEHTWLPWVEVQVADTSDEPISKHVCGGIYDIKEPTVNAVKEPGAWNRMTICAAGSNINVILNNQQILNINLNDWTEPHKNPDGTENKFDIAYKDLPRQGWLGFQDHGFPVWYRNIMLKEM